MKGDVLTAEQRADYYRRGVEEFRNLLEREFRRTHPDGRIHSMPPPSGHEFRVGAPDRKVNVDVTFKAIQSQAHAKNRPFSREKQQIGPRWPRRTA